MRPVGAHSWGSGACADLKSVKEQKGIYWAKCSGVSVTVFRPFSLLSTQEKTLGAEEQCVAPATPPGAAGLRGARRGELSFLWPRRPEPPSPLCPGLRPGLARSGRPVSGRYRREGVGAAVALRLLRPPQHNPSGPVFILVRVPRRAGVGALVPGPRLHAMQRVNGKSGRRVTPRGALSSRSQRGVLAAPGLVSWRNAAGPGRGPETRLGLLGSLQGRECLPP